MIALAIWYLQVSGERDFFAQMVVDAVTCLDPSTLDLKMIGIKKVIGGGLRDSFLVDGVAFKKTFSYAGFEQQPKAFDGAGEEQPWQREVLSLYD